MRISRIRISQEDPGISKRVAGCVALIAQKAASAHSRLAESHRRWIDPDDLVQDGLVRALEIDKHHYKRGRGTKFSTYLFRGLDWEFQGLNASLNLPKRRLDDGALVELDKPISDDSKRARELTDAKSDDALSRLACVNAFLSLSKTLRHKNEEALVVLIRGLLFADTRRATPELCSEIKYWADKQGVAMNDLRQVVDEDIRKKLLNLMVRDVIMSEGAEESIRLLECVECGGQFSIAAIRENRFFVSTMTCKACYRKLQRSPSDVSCFGKVKTLKHEGRSDDDIECKLHCPDRAVCSDFTKGRIKMSEKKAVDTVDDDFVDLDTAEGKSKATQAKADKKAKPAKEAKPAKAAKAEKAEKPAKEAKAKKEPKAKKEKVVVDPAPKNIVEWPYKPNSVMLYVFRAMLDGVSKKKLEAKVNDGKHNFKLMLSIMRRPIHTDHTWKLNEEGDQYKIYDVKYQPGVGEKKGKSAKPAKTKKAA